MADDETFLLNNDAFMSDDDDSMLDDDAEFFLTPAPRNPRPFAFNYTISRTLPILSKSETEDLAAVLRSLARGTYPRLDAVTTALNAYNLIVEDDDSNINEGVFSFHNNNNNINSNKRPKKKKRKAWAYFHTITEIPPADTPLKGPSSEIRLDPDVRRDTERDWMSVNPKGKDALGFAERAVYKSAKYRFICFIHKHRIDKKHPGQKSVYTITIWDREVCFYIIHILSSPSYMKLPND